MCRCGVGGSTSSVPITCNSRRWFAEAVSEAPAAGTAGADASGFDASKLDWLGKGVQRRRRTPLLAPGWHDPKCMASMASRKYKEGTDHSPAQLRRTLHFAKPQRPKSPLGPSRRCSRSTCEGFGAAIVEAPSCTEVSTTSCHFLRTKKWLKQLRNLVASQWGGATAACWPSSRSQSISHLSYRCLILLRVKATGSAG